MISDQGHTPYNFPHGKGDPQRVFQRRNDSKTFIEKLPCQREGANSEDLFAVAVTTGELIIGRENFRRLLDVSTTNRSNLLDLRLEETVLDFLSARNRWRKKFLRQQISRAGVWSRKSRKFPLYGTSTHGHDVVLEFWDTLWILSCNKILLLNLLIINKNYLKNDTVC